MTPLHNNQELSFLDDKIAELQKQVNKLDIEILKLQKQNLEQQVIIQTQSKHILNQSKISLAIAERLKKLESSVIIPVDETTKH